MVIKLLQRPTHRDNMISLVIEPLFYNSVVSPL